MDIKQIPPDFWHDNVATNINKNNISPEAWEKICKIRNSPIILIQDLIIGESHKPHRVVPKGYKGYLIDYPEVFNITESEFEEINRYRNTKWIEEKEKPVPALFYGVGHVVYLSDYHYEIIEPFFDMNVANYAQDHIINI